MISVYLNHERSTAKNIEISESLSRFSLKIEPQTHSWRFIETFLYELKNISPRDTFELTLEIDGHCKNISDCCRADFAIIEEHYNENQEDSSQIVVCLLIRKNIIEQELSIYSLHDFTRTFCELDLLEKISAISSKFNDRLHLKVFEMIEEFGSNTIIFSQHTNKSPLLSPLQKTDREKKISLFKENTTFIRLQYTFTPDDFNATVKNSTPQDLKDFFTKAKSLYSLACISNTTEITDDKKIRFKFNGYKTFTTPDSLPDEINENADIAYKIYDWAYAEGRCGDKLGLVRNILTLNTQKNHIDLTQSTWHTIQSNYEIYLKDNISQYLELKNKLLEFITDFNKRTLEITDSFTNSFQSSTIGFITFIVTVVAVNGLKDAGTEKIFSIEYLLISLLICAISTIWMLISRSDTKSRINYLSTQTKEAVATTYKNILSEHEINETIDPTISSIKSYTSDRIFKFTGLWITSTILFIALFAFGFKFTNTDKPIAEEQKTSKIIPANNDNLPKILVLKQTPPSNN